MPIRTSVKRCSECSRRCLQWVKKVWEPLHQIKRKIPPPPPFKNEDCWIHPCLTLLTYIIFTYYMMCIQEYFVRMLVSLSLPVKDARDPRWLNRIMRLNLSMLCDNASASAFSSSSFSLSFSDSLAP